MGSIVVYKHNNPTPMYRNHYIADRHFRLDNSYNLEAITKLEKHIMDTLGSHNFGEKGIMIQNIIPLPINLKESIMLIGLEYYTKTGIVYGRYLVSLELDSIRTKMDVDYLMDSLRKNLNTDNVSIVAITLLPRKGDTDGGQIEPC